MTPEQPAPEQEIPAVPAPEATGSASHGADDSEQGHSATVTPIDQARNPFLMTPQQREKAAALQAASGNTMTVGEMWDEELGVKGSTTPETSPAEFTTEEAAAAANRVSGPVVGEPPKTPSTEAPQQ